MNNEKHLGKQLLHALKESPKQNRSIFIANEFNSVIAAIKHQIGIGIGRNWRKYISNSGTTFERMCNVILWEIIWDISKNMDKYESEFAKFPTHGNFFQEIAKKKMFEFERRQRRGIIRKDKLLDQPATNIIVSVDEKALESNRPAAKDNLDEVYFEMELQKILVEILENLSVKGERAETVKCNELLIQWYLNDLDIKAIAKKFSTSENNVTTRKSRCLKHYLDAVVQDKRLNEFWYSSRDMLREKLEKLLHKERGSKKLKNNE